MMSDPTEPINPVPRPAGPQLWIRDDIGIVNLILISFLVLIGVVVDSFIDNE